MTEGKPMTAEETAEMKRTCTPNITTATRQVTGGYIVTGRIVWVNSDGTPQGVQQDEAVSETHNDLGALIEYYHRFFTFHRLSELRRAFHEAQAKGE